MSENKKSIFLSTVEGALERLDAENERQENIESRKKAIVGLLKRDFEILISEVSSFVNVFQVRYDTCLTFRITAWSDGGKNSSYWEIGVYPYGTSDGSSCQLSVRFFPVSIEQNWRAEAKNSKVAFEMISDKLGEIVASEVSLQKKYGK